jgi:transposase
MSEGIMELSAIGIDVSKDTLDVSVFVGGKALAKQFANTEPGFAQLIGWLAHRKLGQVHACLEATGRYSLGIALALHAAGHVVSVVNPAQIRDFARSRLGRNKSDKADAGHIREYAAMVRPPAWRPPSPALRRLCELQTMRAGFVASRIEWQNRSTSLGSDAAGRRLAEATIGHFAAQIDAVDRAIAETIEGDDDLRGKRDLLLSIDGVGQTLAALVLAELPGPDVLESSAQAVAYAGLNPRQFQSGSSINRPTLISKTGNAVLRAGLYMPAMVAMRHNKAVAALAERLRAKGRLKPKQILIAAMRKLLVICFGVLKSGKPFDAALAMPGA